VNFNRCSTFSPVVSGFEFDLGSFHGASGRVFGDEDAIKDRTAVITKSQLSCFGIPFGCGGRIRRRLDGLGCGKQ
jgi:hypothetical protein